MNLSPGILLLFFIWCSLFESICTDDQILTRISGGEKAERNGHPYIVSLQGYYKWNRYRVCGGSIVSKRWIVSAGHCVTDYWPKWLPLDAIVGAYNLERTYWNQTYHITARIPHPYYRGGVGPYDIAMLRTDRDIEYSERVKPIMLPERGQDFMRDESLTIAGWGALKANRFVIVLPNKLREAEVSYLPYYDCYRAVSRFKSYYKRNPLERGFNLCTGPLDGSVAGCTGDSGGPLVRYLLNENEMTTESTTMESTTMESTTMESTTMESTTMESTTMESTTMESTTMESMTMEPMTMETMTMETMTMESMNNESTATEPTTEEPVEITSASIRHLMKESNQNRYYWSNGQSRNSKMMPVLVGIISWGIVPCGIKGAPTVYTNVSRHIDFINEYMDS